MQPMKSERPHLGRGAKRTDDSSHRYFVGTASCATASGIVAVVALAIGAAAPIAIGAAAGAVGMGAVAAVLLQETRTWGPPELTLAVDLGGGRMVPLQEGGQVRLGDRIVGNYRRESFVSPVPNATLQGRLIATEKTIKGYTNNRRKIDAIVYDAPLSVIPNVNDGVLDLDFSVVVPIAGTPVSFMHGVNQVTWTLELRLHTKGLNDHQIFEVVVIPVVAGVRPAQP